MCSELANQGQVRILAAGTFILSTRRLSRINPGGSEGITRVFLRERQESLRQCWQKQRWKGLDDVLSWPSRWREGLHVKESGAPRSWERHRYKFSPSPKKTAALAVRI